jgi:hypothetical protein
VHKFSFQWELVLHLSVCILSLSPFFFTGERIFSTVPLAVWLFYNSLFLIGPSKAKANQFRHRFQATIEEFFSPKLLPVLSFSFLLVSLSLSVTGHRLGGPPLCYRTCSQCLSLWKESLPPLREKGGEGLSDPFRAGCGSGNGKELLAYYTMAQTSFLLFSATLGAMALCLAWRVADEESLEQRQGEQWLMAQDQRAFEMRQTLIDALGRPASPIRPEGGPVWVVFGIVAALTFTLLGWHNWYVLPPSHCATLLILLNLLTILMSTLILHLGFFGRLLALYSRNYKRVLLLTEMARSLKKKQHQQQNELDATRNINFGGDLDSWWNCRNFVLNDDLSLDYDIGGLAVSATFLIDVLVFFILMAQVLLNFYFFLIINFNFAFILQDIS